MQTALYQGQTFVVTNPDHYVSQEVWEILVVAYPEITFSYQRYIIADIAYVHSYATGTVTGTVFSEGDNQVIIALPRTSASPEVGVLLQGDKAIYLRSLDPLRYL